MIRNRSFEVHFGWGMAIALAAIVFGISPWNGFWIAAMAGLIVELVQGLWPRLGTISAADALYTLGGGLAGAGMGVLAGN